MRHPVPAELAEARVSCLYPADGGSGQYSCYPPGGDGKNCIPGCANQRGRVNFCGPNQMKNRACAWPPGTLRQVMQIQDDIMGQGHQEKDDGTWAHSEVVLDTYRNPWKGSLPDIIEAFVIRLECDKRARTLGEDLHRRFIETYGAERANMPPLLLYDQRDQQNPFKPWDPSVPVQLSARLG